MKLLISPKLALSRYVSREFFYIMEDLTKIHGWRHLEPDVLWDAPPDAAIRTLKRLFGEIPEVILYWEDFLLSARLLPPVMEMGCRTFMFVDDLHWFREENRLLRSLGFTSCDAVVTPNARRFDDFYPEFHGTKPVYWVPHSASPDFHLPFNHRPTDAVLLSGAINDCYPLREAVKALHDGGQRHIVWHRHPGYRRAFDSSTDPGVGRDYARLVNQHRVAFADASKFRYLIAKYFEIPATGALLLGDDSIADWLRDLGFAAGRDYVPVSAERLEQQIAFVLDPANVDEIDSIRKNGRELVLAFHKTSDRARLIDQVCMAATNTLPFRQSEPGQINSP